MNEYSLDDATITIISILFTNSQNSRRALEKLGVKAQSDVKALNDYLSQIAQKLDIPNISEYDLLLDKKKLVKKNVNGN